MMRGALRFPPDYDAHILGVKAEFPEGEIFRDRKILAVTAAMQELRQCLPLIAGPGLQADAVVLVALCIDVPIDQANLLPGLEACALE